MKTASKLVLAGAICSSVALPLHAATSVGLQQATATFSQTGGGYFSVETAINGSSDDELGWAIDPHESNPQTAVFETTSDIGYQDGSVLTFTLDQSFMGWGEHLLGRFRISVTTDDRSTFADSEPSKKDVTAD